MDYFSIEKLQELAERYVVPFGINILLAALIFFCGRALSRLLVKLLTKLCKRANLDASLSKFLTDLAYMLLLLVVSIAALERLGIKTTAAIAVLGAMGLAVGLALQGSLGNFASGVMLILFKPYKVGDLVNLGGHTGVVDAIQMFNTIVVTLDNRKVIIPNGNVTGNTIENISALGKIRIDMVFGIGYQDDITKAKRLMLEVLQADSRVLSEPAPQVAVSELADSSVNFVVRPWVHPDHYWDVMFDVTEKIKLTLDANGVTIPFPQRDVHIFHADKKQTA